MKRIGCLHDGIAADDVGGVEAPLMGDTVKSVLKFAALSAVAFALSACATTSAPQPLAQGDWVLAHWQEDDTWFFPGVVSAREGDQISIQYDDGDVGTQPASEVRPFDWQVGTALWCRWTNEQWYPARITQMSPNRYDIRVAYDDGDKGEINTSRCRSQ